MHIATFGLNDGSNDVGATYTSGIPYYVGISSGGQPAYNISGNELTMDVPYSAISQLNADTTTFKVIAADVTTHTVDYAVYTSGNGGNDRNENNTNNANDPTKGEVTDKSIDVSITDASYTLSKENANSVSGSVMVKGTTNGVDHVSLCFVVYYKNGTYDYGSWVVGPSEFHQSFGGYSINEFFNSTEGNWNKWEFNISGTYPMSNYNWVYDMFKGESKVSKVVIYARAFKDAQETK